MPRPYRHIGRRNRVLPFYYSKAETLVDNFNGGAIDTTLWTVTNSTTTASETGGNLQFVTTTTNGYATLLSIRPYDLTSSFVTTQLVNAGNQSLASLEIYIIQVEKDASNILFWYLNTGTLHAYKIVAGSQTSIATLTYNAALHRYFRIRESGGTCFFDYSGDGLNWTNLTSLANPWAITAIKSSPSVGTFANEASGTTVLLDNHNFPIPPLESFKQSVNQPLRSRILRRQMPPQEWIPLVTAPSVTPANDVSFWKQPVNQSLRSRTPKRPQPPSPEPPFPPLASQAPYVSYWKRPVEQFLKSRTPKRQQPAPNQPPPLRSSAAPYVNYWKRSVEQPLRSRVPKRLQPIEVKPPFPPLPSRAPYLSYWKRPTEQPLRGRIPRRQQPPEEWVPLVTAVTPPTTANDVSFWLRSRDPVNYILRNRVPKRMQLPRVKPPFPPLASQPPYISYWVQPVQQFVRSRTPSRQQPRSIIRIALSSVFVPKSIILGTVNQNDTMTSVGVAVVNSTDGNATITSPNPTETLQGG